MSHSPITAPVNGTATTQKIQKKEDRASVALPSLETSNWKKAVPNRVATSEDGRKTSVMIAMVCIEALSLFITLLSCWVTMLKDCTKS